MKYILNFILWILILCSQVLQAQQTLEKNTTEKFVLFTDRSIYTIGEPVQFFAKDISGLNTKNLELSKVLYIELVTFDGIAMTQKKYQLVHGETQNTIMIPDGIPTGIYYFKVYTRYLRNAGPQAYTFYPITVVNYLSEEVLQRPEVYEPDFKLDTVVYADYLQRVISLEKDSLVRREMQLVSIDSTICKSNQSIVVSVLPGKESNNFYIQVIPKKQKKVQFNGFTAETRGISISGTLVDDQTGESIPYQGINISLIDNMAQSLAVLTDSLGRFYISLPDNYGDKEVLVTSGSSQKLSIRVDNDFCNQVVQLPFVPFTPDSAQMEGIKNMINTRIIEHQYQEAKLVSDTVQDTPEIYYQEPSQRIILDDYIEMPRLSDYFYELITSAGIRERNGKKFIEVFGKYADLMVFEPLVILDNVIINDVEHLMDLPPSRIERIEVFNKPYIKGDITYGGIVSLFSKAGDMGGIDLPKSGLFFNYQMYASPYNIGNENASLNEPIFRNSLYWKTSFGEYGNNCIELGFNVGDRVGDYTLILRGIGVDGILYCQCRLFHVKK